MLNNKSILITGGTGSFGKMFTKIILSKYPNVKRLVIFLEMNKNIFKWEWSFQKVSIQQFVIS